MWFALGQFEQFFLFPLILCCRHGWDLRSYFLANLNGRTVVPTIRLREIIRQVLEGQADEKEILGLAQRQ